MPIYVYRCSHCGHQQDVLQKMSDPRLTVCPSCGQSTYEKQVTAAGFRLKGSGWYETDFRGGKSGSHSEGVLGSANPASSDAGSGSAAGNAASSGTPSAPSPSPATSGSATPATAPG
ncbi:FmdB family zinc ribbon protein [Castellaniella sp.]|uniref:FmdB family zinc ribbon protein n=1 Tax=Castellaniella sp. TaxID=1955812 RepID=UPI002AFE5669|nr:FmdB family zinc ribbon protein [Castellaniella sp.]